jgi:hypothetical protein
MQLQFRLNEKSDQLRFRATLEGLREKAYNRYEERELFIATIQQLCAAIAAPKSYKHASQDVQRLLDGLRTRSLPDSCRKPKDKISEEDQTITEAWKQVFGDPVAYEKEWAKTYYSPKSQKNDDDIKRQERKAFLDQLFGR